MKLKNAVVYIGNSSQGLGALRSCLFQDYNFIQINDKLLCSTRFSQINCDYIKISKDLIKNCDIKIIEILKDLSIDSPSIVFGKDEDINYLVFKNKDLLKNKFYIPDFNYEIVFDKYLFNQTLNPENRILTDKLLNNDFREYLGKGFILKSKKGNVLRNLTSKKAIVLEKNTENFMKSVLKKINPNDLILQKIINSKSNVLSVCSVAVEGKMYGLFEYEKLRQRPDKFGTGTYLKSIRNDEIYNIAKELIKKLNYTGISEVEFIWDEEDSSYKVIEINPRTWKSVHFATLCGQNMVQKYAKWVFEGEIEENFEYALGKYWVDLFTDIPQMFREKKIFKYNFCKLYECTWDLDDPMPFIFSVLLSPFILLDI